MRIIRGKYGHRRFDVPTNITARPTTDFARENIFNVLENLVDFEGMTALDLFSGTGAISFEFLSRGCASVTSVEKAPVQYGFIRSVKEKLHENNLMQVRGDVFKFINTCTSKFDLIFADPPYDLPNLADVPQLLLDSPMLKPNTIIIVEHSHKNDFSHLPHFYQQRIYGKVNFSIFKMDYTNEAEKSLENEQNDTNPPDK